MDTPSPRETYGNAVRRLSGLFRRQSSRSYNLLDEDAHWDKIEQGIQLLVARLNAIEGITTRFSCHGHWGDPDAWVIFSCRQIDWVYKLWSNIKDVMVRKGQQFKYFWTLMPHFSRYNGIPCFMIKAVPKGKAGFLGKLVLEKETEKLLQLLQIDDGIDKQNSNGNYDSQPICALPEQPALPGVFSLAITAPLSVGSHFYAANMTVDELRHRIIYQVSSQSTNSTKKIPVTALVFSPLEHSTVLWDLEAALRQLYFEGACKRWAEIDGYFLADKKVILKLN